MNRHIGVLFIAITALIFGTVVDAQARITKILITSVESPTFGGYSFPGIGQYEKIRGIAYGEVDPTVPRNAIITDIGFAPVNADGKVEYEMDIYILTPVDPTKGNGKLFYEVNNRGNKLFGSLNNSTGGNNPSSTADVENDFLMHQGYTVAWGGWDPLAPSGADRLTITVPVATYSGATIKGPSYDYIVFDNPTTSIATLVNTAVTTDPATLTRRSHVTDAPTTLIQGTDWEFVNETTIRLLPPGTLFALSDIYELEYVAKDPLVLGLGFASTRDFISFLRYETADDDGNPNPLFNLPQYVLGFTISQPARYMNDFQTLGFNTDESGRQVFDGVLNWIGGGSGVNLNFRFGQTGRTERNRQNLLYPEGVFPFAYPPLYDPYTGKTAGRIVRCTADGTCPKVFEANSANEYWVKTASLLHSDLQGKDLPDPHNVRFYLMSGVQHTVSGSTGKGTCDQERNHTNPSPVLRALFVALDQWVTEDITPPKSEVPRQGTKVFAPMPYEGLGYIPQADLGWPDIPGVLYTGVFTVRHLFDFGTRFDQGILDINPPAFEGPVYPAFVSKVDKDGNEIAGIKLPEVAAPIATTTGWGLRAPAYGGPDGCEGSGQWIEFYETKAERIAAGDPRKSLEERYKDHDGYVKAVEKAVKELQKRRFLLPEDAQKYIDDAIASDVLQ